MAAERKLVWNHAITYLESPEPEHSEHHLANGLLVRSNQASGGKFMENVDGS